MKTIARIATLCAFLVSGTCVAADMPQAGNPAPEFKLSSQKGDKITLHQFHGEWVVLYFYPKDFTSGCSLEAHTFQADMKKYRERNAVIVGISADTVDSHKQFCTKEGLDFKLLSDPDHKVSQSYGSAMDHNGEMLSARHTFLIDPNGVVRKTYPKVDPAGHSAEVIAELDKLQAETR